MITSDGFVRRGDNTGEPELPDWPLPHSPCDHAHSCPLPTSALIRGHANGPKGEPLKSSVKINLPSSQVQLTNKEDCTTADFLPLPTRLPSLPVGVDARERPSNSAGSLRLRFCSPSHYHRTPPCSHTMATSSNLALICNGDSICLHLPYSLPYR